MTAEKSAKKQRGKPFKKGQSGNPKGKPTGTRNKITLAAEALLDGEAEAITRKVIELAKNGDITAIRLCLERIIPPLRHRPLHIVLPAVETAADVLAALSATIAAVAEGEVTPDEGAALVGLLESQRKALETVDLEGRLAALERRVSEGAA